MNVLWLTPEPPLPPYTGGRERARRMVEHVARRRAVHLVTYASAHEGPLLEVLGKQLAGLTALPYPRRGEPYHAAQRAVVPGLRAADGRPWDTVHVQGLTLWPAGLAAGGHAARPRRVLDLFDVPAVQQQRLLRVRPRWWGPVRLLYTRWREARALQQADVVVVASAHDVMMLRASHPGAERRLVTVPNGVDLAYWRETPAGISSEPATLIFPGAFNYAPNIDAARVLVNEVLPRVQAAVPGARVVLAGRAPDAAVTELAAPHANVTLCADPPDMRPLLARATLMVVPLRAGSGTRLKILQALAAGRPVVSTPLGAEGLDLEAGRLLSIAPLTEAFADEVVRLLRDPAARHALAQAGGEAVEAYAWEKQLRSLDRVYPAIE